MAWSWYFHDDHAMILPWSNHGEYESPWSYHVIAWLSKLTMAVNRGRRDRTMKICWNFCWREFEDDKRSIKTFVNSSLIIGSEFSSQNIGGVGCPETGQSNETVSCSVTVFNSWAPILAFVNFGSSEKDTKIIPFENDQLQRVANFIKIIW